MGEVQGRYGAVTVRVEGYVAVLEWSNPPSNHVTVASMTDLADSLEAVDAASSLRASVFLTHGKVFCAGADLAGNPSDVLTGAATNPLYDQVVRRASTRKPLVVAVQGAAVGAGLGLALVADFRIAAPESRFSANFVKLGFHPGFAITYLLPRLIGQQRATLMCLTGRRIKADQALDWGLVDQVVAADQLRGTALALASELAEGAPLAVQSTRATLRKEIAALVRRQTDHEHVEQSRLRGTADFGEGVRAVAERRPGRFIGV